METALEKQRRASGAPAAQEQQRRTSRYGSLSAIEKQRRTSNFTRLSLDQQRRSSQLAPLDYRPRQVSQSTKSTFVHSRPVSQFITLEEEEKPRRPSQFTNLSPREVNTQYEILGSDTASKDDARNKNRRCLWITLIMAGILLGIALGVGLGFGLTKGNGSATNAVSTDSASNNLPSGTTTTSAVIPGSTSIIYDANLATSTQTWQPKAGAKWQIQIYGAVTNLTIPADVYDIDLFDNDATSIAKLHAAGRKVICYFSAGSYEDFRPDADSFLSSDYGKELVGWPGEYWLNTSTINVRKIMVARLNLAVSKGCDGMNCKSLVPKSANMINRCGSG